MGACAQIAVFTYAVMRRTPRYEIRLAAPFADNLMNSVAHCGCDGRIPVARIGAKNRRPVSTSDADRSGT